MTVIFLFVLLAILLPLVASSLSTPSQRRFGWVLALGVWLALAIAWVLQPAAFHSATLTMTWFRAGDWVADWGLELQPGSVGWLTLAVWLVLAAGVPERTGVWRGLWLVGMGLLLLGSTLTTSLAGYVLTGWAMIAGGGTNRHWRWLALADAAMVMAVIGMQRALGTGNWESLGRAEGMSALMSLGWPFLLLVAAVGVRAAQFPLHAWLGQGAAALRWFPLWAMPLVLFLLRLLPVWGQHPQVPVTLAAVGGLGALVGSGVALCQREARKGVVWLAIAQIGWLILALGTGEVGLVKASLLVTVLALLPLTQGVALLWGDDLDPELGGRRGIHDEALLYAVAGAVALVGLPFVSGIFWSQGVLIWHLGQRGNWGMLVLASGVLGLMTAAVARFVLMAVRKGTAEAVAEESVGWPVRIGVLGSLFFWVAGLVATLQIEGEAIGDLPVWPSLLSLGLWLAAWGGMAWWSWRGFRPPSWVMPVGGVVRSLREAGHVARFYVALDTQAGSAWGKLVGRLEGFTAALETVAAVGTVLAGEALRRLQGWRPASYAAMSLVVLVLVLWVTR